MHHFRSEDPSLPDIATPCAAKGGAIPLHQSKCQSLRSVQPFRNFLRVHRYAPICSYLLRAGKLIWRVSHCRHRSRHKMNGQRNALASGAPSLTLTPSLRNRSHAWPGGREVARRFARFSSQFLGPFLFDTPLSTSPVLLDTKALSSRHSVTSRIRFNSSFYNWLTFSSRHLNRTPQKANFVMNNSTHFAPTLPLGALIQMSLHPLRDALVRPFPAASPCRPLLTLLTPASIVAVAI
jgi:hypothetical protein